MSNQKMAKFNRDAPSCLIKLSLILLNLIAVVLSAREERQLFRAPIDSYSRSADCKHLRWNSTDDWRLCRPTFESDKMLDWTHTSWMVDQVGSDIFRGHMRLTPSPVAYQDNLPLDLWFRTRKARVFFPHYEPTDNENCQFIYKYRSIHSKLLKIHEPKELSNPGGVEFDYAWPKLRLVVVKVNTNWNQTIDTDDATPASVLFYDLLDSPSYLSEETEQIIQIGKQLGSTWTLVLLIETKLSAPRFELSEMRFSHCQPKSATDGSNPMTTEGQKRVSLDELYKQQNCAGKKDKFQCKISGRCLDMDYRCDFGRDCGSLDDSDELDCDSNFEGRCDFEESDLCQWVTAPHRDSWSYVGEAGLNTLHRQATIETGPRPALDHTFQSKAAGGHYMLINAKHLNVYKMSQLIGPRVELRPGHDSCKFRFWVQTPLSLKNAKLRSSHLRVGYDDFNAQELFLAAPRASNSTTSSTSQVIQTKRRKSENNWRRFEVTLFDHQLSKYQNASIYALHLAFANITSDLEIFSLANGYLALDDFSFSKGCMLSIYNEAPISLCSDDEFRCTVAPPTTPDRLCIPMNRVCDFKIDCGLEPKTGLAADQFHCVHTFNPLSAQDYENSGLQVEDYSSSSSAENFNPAFKIELATQLPTANDSTLTFKPLTITSQWKTFEKNFMKRIRGMRYIREAAILLPRFNQAHANCKVELIYEWSQDASNLQVSVYLTKSRMTSILLRRTTSSFDKDIRPYFQPGRRQAIWSLGIGEHNSPFNVQIVVTYLSQIKPTSKPEVFVEEFAGDFRLWSYKFSDCAHEPGLINISQAQVLHVEDLSDDDDDEREDTADLPNRHQVSLAQLRDMQAVCKADEFQCQQPILCLDGSLVCDMQRDCQESGLDELDCSERGYIQYDFESIDQLDDWTFKDESVGSLHATSWIIRKVDQQYRDYSSTGPAFDHSHRSNSELGKHLTLSDPRFKLTSAREAEYSFDRESFIDVDCKVAAWASTPRMTALDSCRRLVMYMHNWQEPRKGPWTVDTIGYQILVRYFKHDGQFLVDRTLWVSQKPMPLFDYWYRVELDLPHAQQLNCLECQEASEFSILIFGSIQVRIAVTRPMLAIDDLVFGPKCQLAKVTPQVNYNYSATLEPEPLHEEATVREPVDQTSRGGPRWTWVVVSFAVSACAFGLLVFAYMDRKWRQLNKGSPSSCCSSLELRSNERPLERSSFNGRPKSEQVALVDFEVGA